MSHSSAVTSASERLHALDALRAIALLLGIVLHAAMSFVWASPRFWIIQDIHPSLILNLLSFTIHVFRMTTFFLMAGFFARMSFRRRGSLGFVRDRLQRIALPLVIGWPLVYVPIALIVIWAANFPNGGPLQGASGWMPALPNFRLTHLWFLYVLLELYVAMLLLRGVIVRLDASGALRALIDRLFASAIRNPLAPLVLAIPFGIAFWLDPRWGYSMEVRTPDQSLITNAQAWICFGTAFGVGWLLHRRVDLLRLIERRWLAHLLLAIVLILTCFVLAGVMISAPGAPKLPYSFATLRLVAIVLYASAIWVTTFAAIGLVLRFMSGFSPTWRYLADASYWLYLIHIPIVMALQVALSQFDWPGLVKFAIILVVALPPMLASYHLLVRFTFIGAVLNGRRAEKRILPQGGIATA
ncbi:acyltransferase family protein [Bradyrhizobium manausense]|uniref:acyltransferase family protein n=1 Tax=Bradyrhizobium manausense TaxID=989370 RepID=UPI001BAA2F8B|nr:acyltransferase family protein [Bradyrhizobium manausense]MBR1087888.1 acyltransferase family protein [Bradyrhizobium manausense]